MNWRLITLWVIVGHMATLIGWTILMAIVSPRDTVSLVTIDELSWLHPIVPFGWGALTMHLFWNLFGKRLIPWRYANPALVAIGVAAIVTDWQGWLAPLDPRYSLIAGGFVGWLLWTLRAPKRFKVYKGRSYW